MHAAQASDAPVTVTLAGETDFEGFRTAARRLVARGVAPDAVTWSVADRDEPGLFGAEAAPASNDAAAPSATLRVSPAFVELCRQVALHADPARFALMYRLLWRLQREPGLRDDPLDADVARAQTMAQAVRRDMHKMKAFVRFREVPQAEAGEPTLHVAWFEPEHHIVEAVAGFFMRRFAGMRWAILTPERCVRWNGEALEFTPGAKKEDAPPADAGEALWLTYYRSIFNPARLKLRAMKKEMPRRYWPNLPEAELISGLAGRAYEQSAGMVEQAPTTVRRRIPIATPIAAARPPLEPGDAEGELAALSEAAAGCRECPLGAHATQTVWGEGPAGASLMLVGEQPGDQEDLQGRPFVGPAGQLLMRAMAELGWPREQVYITNAVKHFKYELRGRRRIHKTPAQKEADACLHWLEDEIALVKPRALVALGATAARQLMGRAVAVTKERGQWLERGDGLRVLITLHPSALLRMEPDQRDAAYRAWLDDLRRGDDVAA